MCNWSAAPKHLLLRKILTPSHNEDLASVSDILSLSTGPNTVALAAALSAVSQAVSVVLRKQGVCF